MALPPTLPSCHTWGQWSIHHTVPPTTLGGSGSSTYTIPPTTLGGTGPSTMVPQVPLIMQVHHVPANPTTMVSPSHINLGSNLPFMARLNFPDLAQLINEPIR